jgi:hypothetical protein
MLVVVVILSFVILLLTMRRDLNMFDEGVVLSDAMLVLHGQIRLIPLSQVNQYLGLADQIRNGDGFDFFGRS